MTPVFNSLLPHRIIRRSQARAAEVTPAPAAIPTTENQESEAPLPTAPITRVQVVDHPVVQHALSMLQNKETVSHDFRTTANQLLLLLTMEATRSLPLREQVIETGRGPKPARILAKSVVFLSISRDGLSLSHNMADCVPDLMVGAISIEPAIKGASPEPRIHLASAPALSETRVILFDPIVGSGSTASRALKLVRRSGATDISLISFMISSQALLRLQAADPQLTVWTAAVDSDWEPKQGSAQDLWDFGARLYG